MRTRSPGNAPSIGAGFTLLSSPVAGTGITAVTAASSSAATDLKFQLTPSAATSASEYTITLPQGAYTNTGTGTALAKNAAAAPIALRIGFKPLLQLRLGSGGADAVVTKSDASTTPVNYWLSRLSLPSGTTGAGNIRLDVLPGSSQGVSALAAAGAPAWGVSPGELFATANGGAAQHINVAQGAVCPIDCQRAGGRACGDDHLVSAVQMIQISAGV
jgi:hypothetical protein